MFKKFALLTALVLALAPVSSALAIIYFNGDADTDSWADGDNWNVDRVPNSADTAAMRGLYGSTSDICNVDTTDCVASSALVGYGETSTYNSTLNILDGGTLTVYGGLQVSCNAQAVLGGNVSTVNVYDGGKITCDGSAYINLTHPNGTQGTSENRCHGTLNMYGGLIDISQDFRVSRNSQIGNHRGDVYLMGGEIYAGSLLMQLNSFEDPEEEDRWVANTTPDYMNITYGVMYIKGDREEQIQGYVDDGWIEAFGGAGVVMIQEDVSLTGHQAGDGDYTKVWGYIPEPGTMLLAGFGVLVLLVSRRKR